MFSLRTLPIETQATLEALLYTPLGQQCVQEERAEFVGTIDQERLEVLALMRYARAVHGTQALDALIAGLRV